MTFAGEAICKTWDTGAGSIDIRLFGRCISRVEWYDEYSDLAERGEALPFLKACVGIAIPWDFDDSPEPASSAFRPSSASRSSRNRSLRGA